MGCFEHRKLRIIFSAGILAVAVAMSATIASANVVIRTGPTFKTPAARQSMAVTHMGSANSAARHQFTVILRDGSDATVVANYFKSHGLQVTELRDKHFLHVAGTFGQIAQAGRTSFERVRIKGEEFIRTTHPPQLHLNI